MTCRKDADSPGFKCCPFTSWLTLGDLLTLSELSFLVCKMGIIIPAGLFGMRNTGDSLRKYTARVGNTRGSRPRAVTVTSTIR